LLQGLLRCAACGAAYTPASAKRGPEKRRYYRCLTRDKQGRKACPARPMPAEPLEAYIIDRVRETAAGITDSTEMLAQMNDLFTMEREKLQAERRQLPAEIAMLSSKGTELMEQMRQASGQARRALDESLGRLNDELGRLEQRLYQVERDLIELVKKREDAEWMSGIMGRFDAVWKTLTPENKSRLLRAMVHEIVIDEPGGTVSISMIDCLGSVCR
jgi:site-specific DNA recombinase